MAGVACVSATLENAYQITQFQNLEQDDLHLCHHENLKSQLWYNESTMAT